MLSEKSCANLQQPFVLGRVRVFCNFNLLLLLMRNLRVESQGLYHRFAHSMQNSLMFYLVREKAFIDPAWIDVD